MRLAPAAPEYWASFLKNDSLILPLAAKRQPASAPAKDVPKKIGSVTAPVVLYAPEPEFSMAARRVKHIHVDAKILVYLQVDRNGEPKEIHLIRPYGLGLDEKAAEAVARYRFSPAMEDGKPVVVEMNVEVHFQRF